MLLWSKELGYFMPQGLSCISPNYIVGALKDTTKQNLILPAFRLLLSLYQWLTQICGNSACDS